METNLSFHRVLVHHSTYTQPIHAHNHTDRNVLNITLFITLFLGMFRNLNMPSFGLWEVTSTLEKKNVEKYKKEEVEKKPTYTLGDHTIITERPLV